MPYCFEYTHYKTSPRNILYWSEATQSSQPLPIYNIKPTVSTRLIDTQYSQMFFQSTNSIADVNYFQTLFWIPFRLDTCVWFLGKNEVKIGLHSTYVYQNVLQHINLVFFFLKRGNFMQVSSNKKLLHFIFNKWRHTKFMFCTSKSSY